MPDGVLAGGGGSGVLVASTSRLQPRDCGAYRHRGDIRSALIANVLRNRGEAGLRSSIWHLLAGSVMDEAAASEQDSEELESTT